MRDDVEDLDAPADRLVAATVAEDPTGLTGRVDHLVEWSLALLTMRLLPVGAPVEG